MKKILTLSLSIFIIFISISCSPASKHSNSDEQPTSLGLEQLSPPAILTPDHKPSPATSESTVQAQICPIDCYATSGYENIDFATPGEIGVDLFISIPHYTPDSHSGLKPLTLTLWRETTTATGAPISPEETRQIVATISYQNYIGDNTKLNEISLDGITHITDTTAVSGQTYMYYLGGQVLDFDHYNPNDPDGSADWSWYITQIGPVYVPYPTPATPNEGILDLVFRSGSTITLEDHYPGDPFSIPLSVSTNVTGSIIIQYTVDGSDFSQDFSLTEPLRFSLPSPYPTGSFLFSAYATGLYHGTPIQSPGISATLRVVPFELSLLGNSENLTQTNIVLGANNYTFCCTEGTLAFESTATSGTPNLSISPLTRGQSMIRVINEGVGQIAVRTPSGNLVRRYTVETFITGNREVWVNQTPIAPGAPIVLPIHQIATAQVTVTPMSIDPSNMRMSMESSNPGIVQFAPDYNDNQTLLGQLQGVATGSTTVTVRTYMQNTPSLGDILPPYSIQVIVTD